MRDPDILHEDFHEVKKDGTLVSREKAVNFIKNLSAKQVETRANSSKVWSRSTIEDRDPAWKNHIAKLTEDDLIEIKQYNNNTLYIRVLGKPDPKMEGGYKFYRMFRYY
ncbi:unnamed protein product [Caenorhabditis angaria]|uniref:Uncharacterized protein n=1 Tax=Caenorhabditis angaria TaxID=860376 RepID=A0A9P1J172_9PELO|nr:unnamed protein product [Caenorhabditis angaria]